MPAYNPVGKSLLFPDFVSPPVKVQYPAKVEATLDLVYAHVAGARPLVLDVYRIPDAGAKPAIIVVHGGSYVGGDPRNDRHPIYGEDDGL